jgi:hypothetical protein
MCVKKKNQYVPKIILRIIDGSNMACRDVKMGWAIQPVHLVLHEPDKGWASEKIYWSSLG